jgi:hypothetical protein
MKEELVEVTGVSVVKEAEEVEKSSLRIGRVIRETTFRIEDRTDLITNKGETSMKNLFSMRNSSWCRLRKWELQGFMEQNRASQILEKINNKKPIAALSNKKVLMITEL